MLASATAPPAHGRASLPALLLASLAFVVGAPTAEAQSVFVNEIHYDNASGDVGEFVEVAGPAGTDLTGWSVVLYNGNDGESYSTIDLSGTIDDEGDGFGTLSFAEAGIQNGAPDGLALVNAGGVVLQFLSYEGAFTATNGPANGMTSEDIGVDEQPAPPAGQSLQLAGIGTDYDDFTWTGPTAESPGDVNAGQTFSGTAAGGAIVVTTANDENNADAECSLREAVIAANTNAAVSGCAPGTEDGDLITFTSAFTITLTLGDILITDDVEIDGSTAGGVTVDGNDAGRIFDVDAAGGAGSEQAVAFTSLALQNGNSSTEPLDAGGAVDLKSGSEATFTDTDVMDSVAGINGGGVHGAGNTTITITTTDGGSSTISGNVARGSGVGNGGGGVWGAGTTTISGNVTVSGNAATGTAGSGGGVFNQGGTMSITGVTITGNSANRAGGGVEDNGGVSTTLTDVTLTDNFIDVAAPGNGGGLHSGGGDVTVTGGSVTGNTAVEGGGLWASGTLLVDGDALIDDNEGTGDAADNGGGGIFNQGGTTTVGDDVTVSNNRATGASGSGGGILNNTAGATLTVGAATISGNTANRAGGGIEDNGGTVTLNGTTLIGNATPQATAAPGNGGGLHTGGGDVTVNGGSVTGNTAIEGGGLWSSGTLVVDGTTVDGNVALSDDDDAFEGGGGLFNQGGTMTVTGATVSDNTADGDGGPGGAGSGGGAFNNGAGTLTVSNSTFSGNSALRAGGGIEGNGGEIVLDNVDFTGNTTGGAPGNGGALHATAGDVTATGGTVSRNTAANEGGGFWINAGFTMDVTGTTFDSNTASGDAADTGGGGLFNNGGALVLDDVTVEFNSADGAAGSGGGIFNGSGGTLTMTGGFVREGGANRAGGGIENAGGTVTLTDVDVNSNFISQTGPGAPGNGGGLHSGGGTVTVNGGVFELNAATEGGGLWTNGTLTIRPSDAGPTVIVDNFTDGDAADNGGAGVYAETGAAVSIAGARIVGNEARGVSASGGGVLVAPDASVSMTLGEISGNEARRAGAGVEVAGGTLTLSQVTVDGNRIVEANPGNGGGLHVGGAGVATVSRSTFADNTADEGAGLWIGGLGSLDLDNSTVSGNAADGVGGGVYDDGGADIALRSATVAGNSAGTAGGGLAQSSQAAPRSYSFQNTIVGDNTAPTGPDCFGTFESGGFNLIEDPSGCTINGDTGTNVTGQDPALGPLADNGGPTATRALGDGSPAVDAGSSAFDVDQRGEPRNDDQDDIGSFEAGDDGDGDAIACTTDAPISISFDADGSGRPVTAADFSSVPGGSFMGATGEFAAVRNEDGAAQAVDLSTCSFVSFDPSDETVIYSVRTAGTVAPGDVFVLATSGDADVTFPGPDVLSDSPGAFALVEGTATEGQRLDSDLLSRVVAAVVYDRGRDVFGSRGSRPSEAEAQAFGRAFAAVFGGEATPAEGDGAVDLSVAAWPNPTRGVATVAFGLAEGGAVRVAVYDVLGREVAVAADRAFGPGRHEVALASGAFPAGAYVVRVQTEGGVRVVRLTVAR